MILLTIINSICIILFSCSMLSVQLIIREIGHKAARLEAERDAEKESP